jgi:hypothetical protein
MQFFCSRQSFFLANEELMPISPRQCYGTIEN